MSEMNVLTKLSIISSSFGRKKLVKTGFIQFFPFCPEETGFGQKKPNPADKACVLSRVILNS